MAVKIFSCLAMGLLGRPVTDEDFVIALMKKRGIFAHSGYFYDYDKGIHILISLLPPPKILAEKLKKIVAFTGG